MTLQFSLASTAPETTDTACVVVGVYEGGVFSSAAARVDSAADGAIKRQVESGDISGKAGASTVLYAPAGVTARRVLVVGLGTQKSFDAARCAAVSCPRVIWSTDCSVSTRTPPRAPRPSIISPNAR